MYSDKLKSLEKRIANIRNKKYPTVKDVDDYETLTAQHYYLLAQALNSIHFVDGGSWVQ